MLFSQVLIVPISSALLEMSDLWESVQGFGLHRDGSLHSCYGSCAYLPFPRLRTLFLVTLSSSASEEF
ncbi:unnamed protein product [Calypogeia fissa]